MQTRNETSFMCRKTRCTRRRLELLLRDQTEVEAFQDEDHDGYTPTPRQMRLVIEWGTEVVARFE